MSRFAAARQSIVNAATKHLSGGGGGGKGGGGGGGGAGNININGLPDPIRGGGGGSAGPTASGGSSIYSSHENLRTMRLVGLFSLDHCTVRYSKIVPAKSYILFVPMREVFVSDYTQSPQVLRQELRNVENRLLVQAQ